MNHLTVLDLFSGAGGFSLGSHAFTDDVWGIELDADAVATQAAAGMKCEQSDITALDPDDYADSPSYRPWMGDLLHIHASPPCQSFSIAGKGEGRNHLDALGRAAVQILLHGEHTVDLSDVPEGSLLVLEPAMWIHVLRPDSISMEQVRSVLPIWESYEVGLYGLGYQTWTGVLHSEQYGVPQTRTRAWLGASLHRPVEAPAPTHSRYHPRNPGKLDAGLRPWVSMSEALGWGMTRRGSYTVTAGGTGTGGAEIFPKTSREAMDAACERGDWSDHLVGFPRRAGRGASIAIDGVEYRAQDFRQGDQPAFGLTEKARSWTHMMQGGAGGEGRPLSVEQPAPTQSSKGTATVTADPDNNWHGKENKAARVELASRRDSDKWTAEHGGRDNRAEEKPGPTVTTEAHRWSWQEAKDVDAPATTIQADIDRLGEAEDKARYGDRAGTHARRVTVAEAAVLQGFPADFPFQGSKTSQFRQVGNAVNPAVAEVVLRSVL